MILMYGTRDETYLNVDGNRELVSKMIKLAVSRNRSLIRRRSTHKHTKPKDGRTQDDSQFSLSQGKVHNPSGQGVAAFTASKMSVEHSSQPHVKPADVHATRNLEEGSARRNITRKKTDAKDTGRYDSRNKKQGGAGKGRWDPMTEAYEGDLKLDKDDPMYVPEEDDEPTSYVFSSSEAGNESRHSGAAPDAYDAANDKAVYGPMLTLSEFKIRVSDAVREYFDSSDADEVVRCIHEMKCNEYHPEVVKRAVSLGLDEGPRERELVSRLLACLHPVPLTDEEMGMGFEVLLDSIDDLVIDIPDAKVSPSISVGWPYLTYLLRAVHGRVLPGPGRCRRGPRAGFSLRSK